MILFHVHDERRPLPPPCRALGEGWTAVAVALDQLAGGPVPGLRNALFDVDVTRLDRAMMVKEVIGRLPRDGRRIFACPRLDRHARIQAGALGATALVERPIPLPDLLDLLRSGDVPPDEPAQPTGLVTSIVALDGAFQGLLGGAGLDADRLGHAAAEIADDIAGVGLAAWLGPIRDHHRGTYQHCLLVTGLATGFGQELGLGRQDLADLTVAALLHDIGKARISPAILDKPGRLDEAETALIRRHPVWGAEYLETRSGVSGAIRHAVRHHHEYLDGSGYPDGLAGAEIGDLTRLLTIVDIFAALIERRAYKPAMPGADALRILREMAAAGRIESALTEAFAAIASRVPPP